MKLWTIQNFNLYEKFKETKSFNADENYVWDDIIFQYKWMVEQMKKRIGLPTSEKIKYPIWAWCQWNGVKQKRPDLRYSAHLPKGTNGVLLELEVNDKSVLLSDFDDFNGVLNYGYLTDTEEEYDKFYNELERYGVCHEDLYNLDKSSNLLNHYRAKLYDSWERIFDLERDIVDESWSGRKENQSIQATLWEVKWEQVISCKKFVAR
ncbi:DUF3841 domain-containing protein [Clostridium drakei]|uniref:DUF3841 domain-containing protein n=1 Tax=Clostridium drakei TaxID=332101 RepID=A0A2U8DWI7_9CLOT|nr:DUF3841 domain-containing protein [Clostridium drakei]AWI06755.1 hypothetical protein B9W14_20390 [Clostridium drakei]